LLGTIEEKTVSINILYIDDNKIETLATGKRLEKHGFTVSAVHSGVEALDLLTEDHKFNLVLLDIMMPEMDGIETLAKIRSRFDENELPVIMLSSKEQPDDIVNALTVGANDYLTKPINIPVSIARINTQLKIAKLSKDSVRKKQLEVMKALVVTYNHQINNPLTVAMLSMSEINKSNVSEKTSQRLEASLEKISKIVTKLKEVTEKEDLNFEAYADDAKMINID
jgi:CheY-like chemotaxis protein